MFKEQAVAYEISYQAEDWGLLVEITGVRERQVLVPNARDAWREIAEKAREIEAKKVLVLSSAVGKYPVLDAFLINSKLDECGVERGWKIAFVNLDQTSFDEVKFAELVALNRGFVVNIFKDEEQARKWLFAEG